MGQIISVLTTAPDVILPLPPGAGGQPEFSSYLPPGAGGEPEFSSYLPPGAGGQPEFSSYLPPGAGGQPEFSSYLPPGAGGQPEFSSYLPTVPMTDSYGVPNVYPPVIRTLMNLDYFEVTVETKDIQCLCCKCPQLTGRVLVTNRNGENVLVVRTLRRAPACYCSPVYVPIFEFADDNGNPVFQLSTFVSGWSSCIGQTADPYKSDIIPPQAIGFMKRAANCCQFEVLNSKQEEMLHGGQSKHIMFGSWVAPITKTTPDGGEEEVGQILEASLEKATATFRMDLEVQMKACLIAQVVLIYIMRRQKKK